MIYLVILYIVGRKIKWRKLLVSQPVDMDLLLPISSLIFVDMKGGDNKNVEELEYKRGLSYDVTILKKIRKKMFMPKI